MIDTHKLGTAGHLVVSGGTARQGANALQRGNDRPVALPRVEVMFARPRPHCRRFVAEHQP